MNGKFNLCLADLPDEKFQFTPDRPDTNIAIHIFTCLLPGIHENLIILILSTLLVSKII